MKLILRILAVLIVVPATYCFLFWFPFSLLLVLLGKHGLLIANIISLLCAIVVGVIVWSKLRSVPQGFNSNILIGAVIFGAIGFSIGFFGPIFFAPQANQGPLLGIFITGPLGFVLGGIGGFLFWKIRVRKIQNNCEL